LVDPRAQILSGALESLVRFATLHDAGGGDEVTDEPTIAQGAVAVNRDVVRAASRFTSCRLNGVRAKTVSVV
jgi:hypothetical protein